MCQPLVAAAASVHTTPPKPQRIMSLMLCNDLLLLMLVPRERIASITFLARDAVAALMPGADAGITLNQGTAEDILLHQPDLILAGTYSSGLARRLAREAGARLLEVEAARDFEDIHRNVRQVAAAVGESERGAALLAGMDARLEQLARHPLPRPLRVVAWSGGGQAPGAGTLTDAIIRASGAHNVAALAGTRYGSFGLEELLAARPDAILQGDNRWAGPSLQDAQTAHPLIERHWRGRRISYPDAAYACGLPQSAEAAWALRELYARLPATELPW
jgi:iron complex transport system substrate-binding protein